LGLIVTLASSFPAIALALQGLEPMPLAAVRLSIAALLAFGWLAWRKPVSLSRSEIMLAIGCGVVGNAVYVLGNAGQLTVSGGAASFILATQPLFMALFAVLIFNEPFGARAWAGAFLCFAGVGLVASGQAGGLVFGSGAYLMLGASLCYAAYALLQRPLLARRDPMTVAGMAFIAGGVAMLPWLPQGLSQFAQAPREAVFGTLFLAFLPTVLGQISLTFALRSYGAARTGQLLYLVPVAAALLTWAVVGDAPTASTLIGGALILAGVALVGARRKS
jgi:drug/metabolite transporter (DMT)-like permease